MNAQENNALNIAIIIGSTRPEQQGDQMRIVRKAEAVGRWVHEAASKRDDAAFKLIDLKDVDLPMFDEALPPSMGQYFHRHTRDWAERIASFDGFVFVTPEYNRSVPAVLKNAIDFLYAEWHNKAAAFVAYGAVGGAHAVEHLRGVLSEVQVAHVQSQVSLGLYTDFVELQFFDPGEHQAGILDQTLDQLVTWTAAMKSVRQPA